MNYKVKQLYIVWEDGDGHKYLIPKEECQSFLDELNDLESELGFPKGGWDDREKEEVQQDIWDLLDSYENLEGELHYVVLENDLIEGEEGEA